MNHHPFIPRTLPVVALLLAASLACGLPAQEPALEEIILEPTVRPEVTATQPPPAELPTATPNEPPLASSIFRDDFNGVLDPGWSWSQSDAPGSSLTHTPGWLRLTLSSGSFFGATPPGNLLLRASPSGDFDLSTYLRFSPHNNFEIAGLVVVFDDDSVLQFGRGFCYTDGTSPACIGDGLYFDNLQDGAAVDGNFATPALLGVDYVLRLQRTGNAYTASYTDSNGAGGGVGSHSVDQAPVLIGLIAAQSTVAQPYADFDYFEMTSQ